jgi:uncharacterized RmlC-like cupin family protein
MSMKSKNSYSQPTCVAVKPGKEFAGKQGLLYAPGISAESVGAQGIHLQILTMPPKARAKAHKHEAHELTASRRSWSRPALRIVDGSSPSGPRGGRSAPFEH